MRENILAQNGMYMHIYFMVNSGWLLQIYAYACYSHMSCPYAMHVCWTNERNRPKKQQTYQRHVDAFYFDIQRFFPNRGSLPVFAISFLQFSRKRKFVGTAAVFCSPSHTSRIWWSSVVALFAPPMPCDVASFIWCTTVRSPEIGPKRTNIFRKSDGLQNTHTLNCRWLLLLLSCARYVNSIVSKLKALCTIRCMCARWICII